MNETEYLEHNRTNAQLTHICINNFKGWFHCGNGDVHCLYSNSGIKNYTYAKSYLNVYFKLVIFLHLLIQKVQKQNYNTKTVKTISVIILFKQLSWSRYKTTLWVYGPIIIIIYLYISDWNVNWHNFEYVILFLI